MGYATSEEVGHDHVHALEYLHCWWRQSTGLGGAQGLRIILLPMDYSSLTKWMAGLWAKVSESANMTSHVIMSCLLMLGYYMHGWVGRIYVTTFHTASDYITWSTRPSWFCLWHGKAWAQGYLIHDRMILWPHICDHHVFTLVGFSLYYVDMYFVYNMYLAHASCCQNLHLLIHLRDALHHVELLLQVRVHLSLCSWSI